MAHTVKNKIIAFMSISCGVFCSGYGVNFIYTKLFQTSEDKYNAPPTIVPAVQYKDSKSLDFAKIISRQDHESDSKLPPIVKTEKISDLTNPRGNNKGINNQHRTCANVGSPNFEYNRHEGNNNRSEENRNSTYVRNAGLFGLKHSYHGNTCYFNSAMQLFLRMDKVCQYIENIPTHSHPLIESLKKLIAFQKEKKPIYDDSINILLSLRDIIQADNASLNLFLNGAQNDTDEFLMILYQRLQEIKFTPVEYKIPPPVEYKIPHPFSGCYEIDICCNTCINNASITAMTSNFSHIFSRLNIMEPENIELNFPWEIKIITNCAITGCENELGTRVPRLIEYPNYLHFPVPRNSTVYEVQYNDKGEIIHDGKVKRIISLFNVKYSLIAILYYEGDPTTGLKGHYFCYIEKNGMYYRCEDATITPVTEFLWEETLSTWHYFEKQKKSSESL